MSGSMFLTCLPGSKKKVSTFFIPSEQLHLAWYDAENRNFKSFFYEAWEFFEIPSKSFPSRADSEQIPNRAQNEANMADFHHFSIISCCFLWCSCCATKCCLISYWLRNRFDVCFFTLVELSFPINNIVLWHCVSSLFFFLYIQLLNHYITCLGTFMSPNTYCLLASYRWQGIPARVSLNGHISDFCWFLS